MKHHRVMELTRVARLLLLVVFGLYTVQNAPAAWAQEPPQTTASSSAASSAPAQTPTPTPSSTDVLKGLFIKTKQLQPIDVKIQRPADAVDETPLPISINSAVPVQIAEPVSVEVTGPAALSSGSDNSPVPVKIHSQKAEPLYVQLTGADTNSVAGKIQLTHNLPSEIPLTLKAAEIPFKLVADHPDSAQKIPVQIDFGNAPIILPIDTQLNATELRVALSGTETQTVRPPKLILPEDNIRSLYPFNTKHHFAILSLPDPRVPRHKRAFDLGIQSLTRAFSDQSFMLDRFNLPWKNDKSGVKSTDCEDQAHCFGLMIYRKDLWRDGQDDPSKDNPLLEIWSVYVVTERTTSGVDQEALKRVHCIASLGMTNAPPIYTRAGLCRALDTEVGMCRLDICPQYIPPIKADASTGTRDRIRCIPFLGPAFSGSMTSLYLAFEYTQNTSTFAPISIHSYAASAKSNSKLFAQQGPVEWKWRNVRSMQSAAINDYDRLYELRNILEYIERLPKTTQNDKKSIALFAESSDYGDGARKSFNDVFNANDTESGNIIRFPPNFSQLRHELEMAALVQRGTTRQDLLSIPRRGLELDARTEDLGTEMPPDFDPQVGARAQELEFERQLLTLKESMAHDATIILSATEVRDRLFLARRLRSEMPGALLVDMEADILLTHPDYIDATRGMLVMSSAQIAGKDQNDDNFIFASDDAALLYQEVGKMIDSNNENNNKNNNTVSQNSQQIRFYMVTKLGLVEITNHDKAQSNSKETHTDFDRFVAKITNKSAKTVALMAFLFALPIASSSHKMHGVVRTVYKIGLRNYLNFTNRYRYAKLMNNKLRKSRSHSIFALIIAVLWVFLHFSLDSISRGIDPWTPLVMGSALLCWIAAHSKDVLRRSTWPFDANSTARIHRTIPRQALLVGLLGCMGMTLIVTTRHPLVSPAAVHAGLGSGTSLVVLITTGLAAWLSYLATAQLLGLKHGLAVIDLHLDKKADGTYEPWSRFIGPRLKRLDDMSFSGTPFDAPRDALPMCPASYWNEDGTQETWTQREAFLRSVNSAARTAKWSDTLTNRMALRLLLSKEIAHLRWLCINAMLLALFGVFSAVAFPIGALNAMLTMNVLYVCLTAGGIIWITIDLERSPLLAMLFNGTPGRIDWRSSLVTYLLLPLVVAALAIWASNVPGVRQWTEHATHSIFATLVGR